MKTIFKTDPGKLREHNEDSGGIFRKAPYILAVVADGMGGHQAGDVASKLALEKINECWSQFDIEADDEAIIQWLEQTVATANAYIFDEASRHSEYKGMGTTLVAALCDTEKVFVVNVGDSRCYLMRDQDALKQVTEDHSLVNELLKAGQITKEDADVHPKKNIITKALGTTPDPECDIQHFQWAKGDRLLLCSDGLSDMVSEDKIVSVLANATSLDEQANQLVAQANSAGGNDNITLTIVEHDDGETL
ncbi:protein phosphatase PrpC [Pullulanibacillus camelliae]|uniref:protein-serine/threonine phosphatase n=1 Tax=Pullulanibacillus camelliae TaxID=1707096 RepID=A0A8J2VNZ6_9BACL|nr:Stp1/IreP family PP2C-type Ser/Thr phosphatase [Pullulanibacillus camelliae]GGE41798.1 protein phosphatase PrpC [Pullulanibacillus camelliae]